MVFGFTPAGAAFLAAVGFLVHRGPGPALGFVLGDAALLVTFLDMLCHPLLLAGVAGFVSTGHGYLLLHLRFAIEPAGTVIVPRLGNRRRCEVAVSCSL